MRPGAWLVRFGLALPLGSCSGDYPLPPTRCDEWCDVTKGGTCGEYYEPANCVVECEQADLDVEKCKVAFDAALTCFRQSPQALRQRCSYDGVRDDCQGDVESLFACTTQNLFDGAGVE